MSLSTTHTGKRVGEKRANTQYAQYERRAQYVYQNFFPENGHEQDLGFKVPDPIQNALSSLKCTFCKHYALFVLVTPPVAYLIAINSSW